MPLNLSSLHRQIRIPPRTTYLLQRRRNIRPHNRHIPNKARNRRKEVAKEDQYPVQLDQEAEEGPAQQDERDTRGKGGCAFPFLAPCEEGCRFLNPDYER
jgi:hypothetical protein